MIWLRLGHARGSWPCSRKIVEALHFQNVGKTERLVEFWCDGCLAEAQSYRPHEWGQISKDLIRCDKCNSVSVAILLTWS
jgi:hypothetical protein